MMKYFKLMTNKTKMKCLGIIALAMISSVLASVWPVRLGKIYTEISGGDAREYAEERMEFYESSINQSAK